MKNVSPKTLSIIAKNCLPSFLAFVLFGIFLAFVFLIISFFYDPIFSRLYIIIFPFILGLIVILIAVFLYFIHLIIYVIVRKKVDYHKSLNQFMKDKMNSLTISF